MDEIKHKIVTTEKFKQNQISIKKRIIFIRFLIDKDFISANDFRFEELLFQK